MARCEIIAELATNHGGDLELAKDMIRAAADHGADWVKTQAFQVKHLSPKDPQYEWLKQSELSIKAHEQLYEYAAQYHVRYLTTIFHPNDAERLPKWMPIKIGHGQAGMGWWQPLHPQFVSWAWGRQTDNTPEVTSLSVIPLYPAPLQAWSAVALLDGYSDHSEGLVLAQIAIAQGAQVVEKHFSLPGRGRLQSWNMGPTQLQQLRVWAEDVAKANNAPEDRWQG